MARQLNYSNFTNLDEITKGEFETLVNENNLEVYTQESLNKYIEDVASLMQKGEEGGELTSEEKDSIEKARVEVQQLTKHTVVDVVAGNIVKVPFYTRKSSDNIIKAHAASIGEIRKWGDKSYKKQANGKWMEVSEHGMTKKEHEESGTNHMRFADKIGLNSSAQDFESHHFQSTYKEHRKEQEKHKLSASKLSDKEHDESELSGVKGSKISISSIIVGRDYFATDSETSKTFEKVKVLSKKKDESGEYEITVQYHEDGKQDKWYLSKDDDVFYSIK